MMSSSTQEYPMHELTLDRLEEVSGGEPDIGGYVFCWYPHEGLYVPPCPTPPSPGGFIGAVIEGAIKGASGGTGRPA
jgi:hypothetical protein